LVIFNFRYSCFFRLILGFLFGTTLFRLGAGLLLSGHLDNNHAARPSRLDRFPLIGAAAAGPLPREGVCEPLDQPPGGPVALRLL
jgi:hypothetical protein